MYAEELLWGYEHIKRLRNKNIVESFKAQNTKGKALTYRLTTKTSRKEPKGLENPIDKEIIEKYTEEYLESDKDFPFNRLEQNKIKEIWSRRKNG